MGLRTTQYWCAEPARPAGAVEHPRSRGRSCWTDPRWATTSAHSSATAHPACHGARIVARAGWSSRRPARPARSGATIVAARKRAEASCKAEAKGFRTALRRVVETVDNEPVTIRAAALPRAGICPQIRANTPHILTMKPSRARPGGAFARRVHGEPRPLHRQRHPTTGREFGGASMANLSWVLNGYADSTRRRWCRSVAWPIASTQGRRSGSHSSFASVACDQRRVVGARCVACSRRSARRCDADEYGAAHRRDADGEARDGDTHLVRDGGARRRRRSVVGGLLVASSALGLPRQPSGRRHRADRCGARGCRVA